MITVDFGEKTGKILKPVNGISNGPICNSMDMSSDYAELGIPYVRLHDTEGNLSRTMVDISRIFSNFDADEEDPENYLFHHTDELLLAIHKLGAGTIYRLGESIDHSIYKRYARAPKDFDKWARICRNIIRHYNEGWANGFQLGIEFWEIWNETDLLREDRAVDPMWSESDPYAYFDLYIITSKLLKKEFPEIKIGGYAAAELISPKRYDYFIAFLDKIKTENAPLDFFSWHSYTENMERIPKNANIVRGELDKRGFNKTISILDEWNCVIIESSPVSFWSVWLKSDIESRKLRKEGHDNQKNMIGASFVAAQFIIMNDLPIEIAAYYDGQPFMNWCGLWDSFGIPQKTFYTFKAYGELYKSNRERVLVDGSTDGIFSIANKSMVMLANFRGGGDYELVLKNPPEGCKKTEIYILDDNSDLALLRSEELKGETTPVKLQLGKHTVILIKLV